MGCLHMTKTSTYVLACLAIGVGTAQSVSAQTLSSDSTVNNYGLPGLIDMPTANTFSDADLVTTFSGFDGLYRGTLAFQILPSVTATFRYMGISDMIPGAGSELDLYLDRSFDIHWQALPESDWLPAIAVGARDIIGTGILSGEYIVATRHFGANDQLAITGGIGWGRFAGSNTFANPLGAFGSYFDTRPARDYGSGGEAEFGQVFRGDAAFFGGVEWQATDRLRLQLEYSNDVYVEEAADGAISIDSPFNVGLTYDFDRYGTIGAQYIYGNTFSIVYALTFNPMEPAADPLPAQMPVAVARRPASATPYDTNWVSVPNAGTTLRDAVEIGFAADGGLLELVALNVDATRAAVRVRNLGYPQEAQALGRVLRVLSATMPPSVEAFEVLFVVNGLDTSRIRVARSDVEDGVELPGGAAMTVALAEVEGAREVADPTAIAVAGTQGNSFTYGLAPYIELSLFDPENPLLYDIGAEATARFEFGNGFVASGMARLPVYGTLDQARDVEGEQGQIPANAPYPVRSQAYLYHQESDAYIGNLTLSHYGTIAPEIYTRLSFGYLERMFAGVSGEVLWQPARGSIALGAELNHVWRRDFDGLFGLQDYNVTTGHVSAYVNLPNNFEAQLDLGRYLAGDWGGTLSIERTFDNGWRVGAFATLTDVPFDEFGEGSFDKGITLTVPVNWMTGAVTRDTNVTVLRPIHRDGGARLDVAGRLRETVIDYQREVLIKTDDALWR